MVRTDVKTTRLLPVFFAGNRYVWLLLGGLWWLSACQYLPTDLIPLDRPGPAEGNLQPVGWSSLPGAIWSDDGLNYWASALEGSATYYAKLKPDSPFTFGNTRIAAGEMVKICRDLASWARKGDPEAFRKHLKANYRLYRSIGRDNSGSVLVTGYYEPLLNGSLKPDKRFRYPIYRKPPDLVETATNGKKSFGRKSDKGVLPYYTHQEIERDRKLAKKDLELVWVDDRIMRFFLHIQGSGRVRLPDGQVMRVGYHAGNGHSYRPIGKLLIDEGVMTSEQVTLQSLRQWLLDHPKEQDRVLYYNPSYVFFRLLEGNAVGNIAVELTPARSIATDHRIFPKGAPAILIAQLPRFSEDGQTIASWQPMARWVVNQDTGGAITGPGRADYFLGFGEDAERTAGVLKYPDGQLLFPVPISPPGDKAGP